MAERGFRFSMDNLTDLRIEPRELTERGFRFVKAPATLLLNRVGAASTDIHPADFSDLLGRFGIDLIAERIEAETHGGRSARLRCALRPGLSVLAAAPGARRKRCKSTAKTPTKESGKDSALGAAPPPNDAPPATGGLAQLARAAGMRRT